MLFSVPDLLGTGALAQSQHRAASRINFGDKTILVSPASAQETKGLTTIKPLQIGDTIPEQLWNLPLQVVNHPNGKEVISLNDYRDKKLIILDFWATWCGSCIAAMPRLDALAKSNFQEAVLLAISSELPNQIERVQQRIKADNLLFVSSKELNSFFSFRYLPHYVWIKDGVVVATSSSKEINPVNFKSILQENKVPFDKFKLDVVNFDRREPFIKNESLHEQIAYSATFLKNPKGISGSAGINIDTVAAKTRLYYNDVNIYTLYRAVSPVSLLENVFIDSGLKSEYPYESRYAYEQIVPATHSETVRTKNMHRDLDWFFNAKSALQSVSLMLWKFTGAPQKDSSDVFDRIRLDDLFYYFNSAKRCAKNAPLLIADGNSVVYLPGYFKELSDIDELKDELTRIGFNLQVSPCTMDIMVVTNDKH